MTTAPVPLPADHIPPGAADWRSADARRWLAASPAAWAHPLWAVLALAAGTVWQVAAIPAEPCTTASPCGTDWPGLGFAALLLLTLYWVARQPRLALAGLAVLLTGHVVDGGTQSLTTPPWLVFVVAAGFAATGLLHRLSVAARQRALAAEAAGPAAHPVPAAALAFRRGRLSTGVAALLLGVAAFGLWQGQAVADAYEERAARLTPVTGTVVRSDEDGLRVSVPSLERAYDVEAVFPEDFPVDSEVDLLVDGDWVRLVAEPYDIAGWEMLVLAGLVGGCAFLANAVDGRTRSRWAHRGPLPVLRVLVLEGRDDGRTWVYAADDPAAERPLLHFHSLYAVEDGDGTPPGAGGGAGGPDGDGEEAWAREEDLVEELRKAGAILKGEDPPPPLREAVLYGLPYTGAELLFVARDDEDDPEVFVECGVTAVKPAVPGPFGRGPAPGGRAGGTDGRGRARGRSVDEVAATLVPSSAPRAWGADRVSRAVGLFLLLVQGGGVWALLDEDFTWTSVVPLVGLFFVVSSASTALGWRLTADRDGLWVAGAWRVRHVPWDRVMTVRHRSGGDIVVAREEDTELTLSPVGWAWLERRLGRDPVGPRAAEEAYALLHRPELRPREPAGPREQGMPVGPLLATASVLWGAAVLLLL
ncbi:hypothetical protein [Streptomyces sp. DH12]|uniref:hypothetical protein n=1 Tax=Streptomyces sp. DH12 TaxID=2857010 RepID=UPI001E2FBBB3|nr:hypothetical protein [Streptomyces sp. DH12]